MTCTIGQAITMQIVDAGSVDGLKGVVSGPWSGCCQLKQRCKEDTIKFEGVVRKC